MPTARSAVRGYRGQRRHGGLLVGYLCGESPQSPIVVHSWGGWLLHALGQAARFIAALRYLQCPRLGLVVALSYQWRECLDLVVELSDLALWLHVLWQVAPQLPDVWQRTSGARRGRGQPRHTRGDRAGLVDVNMRKHFCCRRVPEMSGTGPGIASMGSVQPVHPQYIRGCLSEPC